MRRLRKTGAQQPPGMRALVDAFVRRDNLAGLARAHGLRFGARRGYSRLANGFRESAAGFARRAPGWYPDGFGTDGRRLTLDAMNGEFLEYERHRVDDWAVVGGDVVGGDVADDGDGAAEIPWDAMKSAGVRVFGAVARTCSRDWVPTAVRTYLGDPDDIKSVLMGGLAPGGAPRRVIGPPRRTADARRARVGDGAEKEDRGFDWAAAESGWPRVRQAPRKARGRFGF